VGEIAKASLNDKFSKGLLLGNEAFAVNPVLKKGGVE
jgi:hypothetical protein